MFILSGTIVVLAALAVLGQDDFNLLSSSIPGVPGEDYPLFATAPETSFLCEGRIAGYYADLEVSNKSLK